MGRPSKTDWTEIDKEILAGEYYTALSRKYGIDAPTISSHARLKLGVVHGKGVKTGKLTRIKSVKIRKSMDYPVKPCEVCQKPFKPSYSRQRSCATDECRYGIRLLNSKKRYSEHKKALGEDQSPKLPDGAKRRHRRDTRQGWIGYYQDNQIAFRGLFPGKTVEQAAKMMFG